MASREPSPPPADSQTTEPVDLSASSPHSLHRAVHARRAEYTRPHRVRVKVGTWNVAACPGTDKDLATWFISGRGVEAKLSSLDLEHNAAVERSPDLDNDGGRAGGAQPIHLVGGDKIGLYVLGLQEVVDLNSATTQLMNRVYATDSVTIERWKTAMEAAMPSGYELVACEQLSGLLLLVYASPEISPTISNVSTVSVGTGLLGYLGNKGAVTTRIVLGEATKMVFVNCHLASGHDNAFLDRRIWDANKIMTSTSFAPISFAGVPEDQADKIGDEDFAFWLGDLNFRLDGLPGDDIRRLLMLHTRGEYDLSKKMGPREDSLEGEGIIVRNSDSSDGQTDQDSVTTSSTDQVTDDTLSLPDPEEFVPDPHEDPGSVQATLDSLLPHDQLLRVMKDRRIFQDGWREGPISFLPTYKYDIGTIGLFDSSEKRRAPSWCDRILFRTRRDRDRYLAKIKEEEESRKRDEEMKERGMEHAAEDDEVLFDYDPDHDAEELPPGKVGFDYDEYEDDDDDEGLIVTEGEESDPVRLDIYTAHQRITSSDHKPVVSVFTIDYDSVVPELKAQVHAEVARELDRAENEGRPDITIVIDSNERGAESQSRSHDSDQAVDFGEVSFLQPKHSFLTLANTGRVSATFSFLDKPSAEDGMGEGVPNWLAACFERPDVSDHLENVALGKEVTLEPGETVRASLQISVVDLAHVRLLNDGQAQLEDVLVLSVTDGRDHFIPIRAAWSPTCIGRSIEELIRVPDGGIKGFAQSLRASKGFAGSIPYDLDVRCAAPKELFKLTDSLETLTERVLADGQMLENFDIPSDPGWPFAETTWKYKDKIARKAHTVSLIEALDNDNPLASAFTPETTSMERIEAVSEVLLLFLRSLTDGVVTKSIWARIEQASLPTLVRPVSAQKSAPDSTSEDDKSTILDILGTAPNHNISFVFLTATLAKVIGELAPLSHAFMEILRTGTPVRGIKSIGFLRSGQSKLAEATAARDRRQAKERRVAEIFSGIVCRAHMPEKEKDRKSLEDRQRALLELFLARREES